MTTPSTAASDGEILEVKQEPLPPAIVVAAAPFDNSYGDADVILRSADGVDFYLHKNILRIASAFFADMFSLPQPLPNSPPNGDKAIEDASSRSADAPPIIPVSEDQQALDNLLRMCYPVEKPAFESIQDKCSLLRGTTKYQMGEATSRLNKELTSLCASRPLDVFAAAWSKAWLLARYSDQGRTGNSNGLFRTQAENAIDNMRPDYISHPFEDPARADLVIRSSDGVVFHVLQSFVSFASPVIANMIREKAASESDPSTAPTHSSSQDLELPEDGRTLAALLQLLALHICLLYEAAKKYEVARAMEFAKRCCMADLDWSPVRVYLIAARFDWEDVMKEAAWRAVHEHIERHVPEMATATTATYRRLLVYRQRCRDIIVTAVFKAAETQQAFDTRLPYWCMEAPWLDGSGEMRFWKAIHAEAWDRAEDAERFPPIEDQAILPSSVVAAYNL
ncbi:uncharacterized protein B0H18DRAFT_1020587 [Fomitopsis serialis]|uniref:uncharacterized protein n=1 Tax=Fomitopsis serialis TaxID=139415 RepID=UPI002008E4E4|nr:uncharacterized protein B0H18DRAFT_1020587 [Neoantrodia serialis]KAH9921632.1 hypothetical protein B0H18DRAFT_1020587 [Neoantrodia serialis]